MSMARFVEAIKESVNLLVSLQELESQVERGSEILAETLAAGRRILLVTLMDEVPLARLVKAHWEETLLGARALEASPFEILVPSEGDDPARALGSQAVPDDLLTMLVSRHPGRDLTTIAARSRELGMRGLAVTGADPWLLPGMSDLAIQIPTSDPRRASELILLVCHGLADGAQSLTVSRR